MKLKLGIHAEDITLYKSDVFNFGRLRTLVAMATYSFIDLKWEKWKLTISSEPLGIFEFPFYRNVY